MRGKPGQIALGTLGGAALAIAWLLAGPVPAATAEAGQPDPTSRTEEAREAMRATGSFEVKLAPLETYNRSADAELGRLSIDKTFAGDLEATGQGEMISAGSPASGSAGYVAIERVTGKLHGRSGSFTLQHSATMTPASQEQSVTVVPGSGTEALAGLTGSMRIDIEAGEHRYVFDYSLPDRE